MSEKKEYKKTSEPDTDFKYIGDIYHRMIDEVEDHAIILLDLKGTIQNWNKGAEKIKQYTEAEAVGQNFSIFYLPEDRVQHLPEKMLEQARIYGRAVLEGWRLRKDGTKFWGSITLTALHGQDDEIIGFSKVTRDLSERKLAEDNLKKYAASLEKSNAELQKSEERYQRMIAEVEDYAIILLNENGDIQNWNAGAQKIKGYTADEIIGKNFKMFYLPDDQQAGLPQRLISEAARIGKAAHEGWRVRKDGSRFWGSIVITALHGAAGELIGFSKVTRDLTDKKLAEDKLQRYLIELQVQNKELERFAYVASHDLQEPLRKIRTFIDVIANNADNKEITNAYFNKITGSAQRMSELIKAILNYSRLGKDHMETSEVDLNIVLKNVLDDFEFNIQEKDAAILSEQLPIVRGNELQIGQVFTNIIGNGLKFSVNNPEIKISSTLAHSDKIPGFPLDLARGEYWDIVFCDNGIGFDDQYATQIFALFQRLHGKQEYPGTGIGLALCKRILENHGGFILATSKKGNGAKFHIYFPLTWREGSGPSPLSL